MIVLKRYSPIKVSKMIDRFWKMPYYSLLPLPPKFCISVVFVAIVSPKRNWKQCLCKSWGDKQRVLWYFPKWPISANRPLHCFPTLSQLVSIILVVDTLNNGHKFATLFCLLQDENNPFSQLLDKSSSQPDNLVYILCYHRLWFKNRITVIFKI